MTLPFHIIELLKKESGSELRLPSDCEVLSLDIEGKTGVHLGATTLKRLIGLAQDERTPHQSTLEVIARYLGFTNWEQLMNIEDKGNSDFGTNGDELRADDMSAGMQVEVTYLPDRAVTFQYLGNRHFVVISGVNSKLSAGDEVEIFNFVLHHPLLVLNVWRNGMSLGQFTAGRVSGLSSIQVLPSV